MNAPILVKDLIHLLPHRAPMIWVDQVLEVEGDYQSITGICSIDLKADALYMNGAGKIRGSAVVEFTAQSFGYLKAAHQILRDINDPPKNTYLTGVRSCQSDFSQVSIESVESLHVKISVLREIKPLTFVRGEIFTKDGSERLGYAEIQVYVE